MQLRAWAAKASVRMEDPSIIVDLEDFISETRNTPSTNMNLARLSRMDKLVADIAAAAPTVEKVS